MTTQISVKRWPWSLEGRLAKDGRAGDDSVQVGHHRVQVDGTAKQGGKVHYGDRWEGPWLDCIKSVFRCISYHLFQRGDFSPTSTASSSARSTSGSNWRWKTFESWRIRRSRSWTSSERSGRCVGQSQFSQWQQTDLNERRNQLIEWSYQPIGWRFSHLEGKEATCQKKAIHVVPNLFFRVSIANHFASGFPFHHLSGISGPVSGCGCCALEGLGVVPLSTHPFPRDTIRALRKLQSLSPL